VKHRPINVRYVRIRDPFLATQKPCVRFLAQVLVYMRNSGKNGRGDKIDNPREFDIDHTFSNFFM